MTYPQQYPPQPGYPQAYAQPQPQYPAQPPMPQYPPAAPAYPAQPYPPQQYAPAYPAAPAVPLPTGTLDTFYEQPSTSGKSWVFKDKPIGTWYAGIVARPVTNADVRAQTDNSGNPQRYKDGRPKFVLVVPMLCQPTAEYPDGQAGWWVKGQARDELARAMQEAGAPTGPPEAGATIRVTLVSKRPVPGMNDAFVYRVEYVRPGGGVGYTAPVEQVQVPQQPMQAPVQYAPQQVAAPVQYQQPPMPQQIPAGPPPQVQAPAGLVAAAPVPVPAAANPLSAEQQELLAKLTGQPTG